MTSVRVEIESLSATGSGQRATGSEQLAVSNWERAAVRHSGLAGAFGSLLIGP
ncbi:hypothetical protein QF015_004034 [Paenarthrobacter sp. TE4293]